MHDVEPYYRWMDKYSATRDERSPFFGREYSEFEYSDTIYGYYIHPQWDYIGSETLYVKILFVDYEKEAAIIECMGEWNDAVHNDIMHLKRNVIDQLLLYNINKYILIGESVFNFHGSDDSYYEEWFDDIGDGYIAVIGFSEVVKQEWSEFNLDSYLYSSPIIDKGNWRTKPPERIIEEISTSFRNRIYGK